MMPTHFSLADEAATIVANLPELVHLDDDDTCNFSTVNDYFLLIMMNPHNSGGLLISVVMGWSQASG